VHAHEEIVVADFGHWDVVPQSGPSAEAVEG
jgi:hypothetical protein